MKVLITGVGGPTPRSFAHSLKTYSSKYKNIELIGTDINSLSIGLYQKNLFDRTYLVPHSASDEYWSRIEEIVQRNSIEFAVILPELEVLEWSRKELMGNLPCKVLLPHYSVNKILLDKAKTTNILKDLYVVPPSISFARNDNDLESLFEELGQIFWVRSSSGTSGLGSLCVDSLQSLKNWIEINPTVNHFLASKYLTGRNLACKLLYWKGKLLRTACAERVNYIMSKVAPSGITGNTSFGRLLNQTSLVDISVKAMDRIFENTNSEKHGFFTVDFKEDSDGTPFITEINVRHVAFTQCFAAAGANFAEDTISLLANDVSMDLNYKMYEFELGTIFLRDVDERPIIMNEINLLMKT
jgi:hypothetical protein